MKKLLLLASIALAMNAGAQNFKFSSNGVELRDGETLNITDLHERVITDLIFDPKLTVTTTQAGPVKVTINFAENQASPALSDEDADLNYINGVGKAKVQICSSKIALNCQTVLPGAESSWTGSLDANYTENLLVEQVYTVGTSVNEVEGLTINSKFTVTVEQGGEKKAVTFVVNLDPASIDAIVANSNAASAIYNLQGRKLAAPAKGINIINGKKVII
ncbi:MAG: hypothetical protein NC301_06755 [Bacteroides sp.]|nr:hypothetical protein [Bacteroides sp.]MCM1378926.1 hypothetical protein [Bacteroides sp.]MCM1445542.1 hypothetical protein [Prevotella sp.]